MSPQSPELVIYEENYFNQPFIEREINKEKNPDFYHENEFQGPTNENKTPKRDINKNEQKENIQRTRKKIFDPIEIKNKQDDNIDPLKMESSASSKMLESNRSNIRIFDQLPRMSSNSSAEEFHRDKEYPLIGKKNILRASISSSRSYNEKPTKSIPRKEEASDRHIGKDIVVPTPGIH